MYRVLKGLVLLTGALCGCDSSTCLYQPYTLERSVGLTKLTRCQVPCRTFFFISLRESDSERGVAAFVPITASYGPDIVLLPESLNYERGSRTLRGTSQRPVGVRCASEKPEFFGGSRTLKCSPTAQGGRLCLFVYLVVWPDFRD